MLTPEQLDQYIEKGFIVVRGILRPDEVKELTDRADEIAAGRTSVPENEMVWGRNTGVSRRRPLKTPPAPVMAAAAPAMGGAMADTPAMGMAMGASTMGAPTMGMTMAAPMNPNAPNGQVETLITDDHIRRGVQVYPRRRKPVERKTVESAIQALRDVGDPWADVTGMQHLIDHDDVFRRYSGHANVVSVLQQIIGPHVKSFFDHLFYKGPYGPHNRYHQDGFFEFSDRACTVWFALDKITPENGCLRYIPDTAGYGQFKFDAIADGVGPRELALEEWIPMEPGDAVFHDRWTLHCTGPNETDKGRRGWATHYASAKSRFVFDPTFSAKQSTQTPEGLHLRDGQVDGNMQYRLVCGREFPGCI